MEFKCTQEGLELASNINCQCLEGSEVGHYSNLPPLWKFLSQKILLYICARLMMLFFFANTVSIFFRGPLNISQSYISLATHWSYDPDLFRENQGVCAEEFWESFAFLALVSPAFPFSSYWKEYMERREVSRPFSGNQDEGIG